MKVRYVAALAALAAAIAFGATSAIDPKLYLDEVKYLSSAELRGRLTGSPELEKAAAYLRAKYDSFGLQPLGGSFEQAFSVTTDARLGSGNRFTFVDGSKTVKLGADDFVPFNFSAAGKLAGSVVFAGYGITAPEYNYDD